MELRAVRREESLSRSVAEPKPLNTKNVLRVSSATNEAEQATGELKSRQSRREQMCSQVGASLGPPHAGPLPGCQ